MDICIDFDGTCVTHEFPNVGNDIGAIPVLKELVKAGHNLILFTMRSDIEEPLGSDENIHYVGGNYLTDAINWFKTRNIPLYGIQSNPTQLSWTTSPKAYGQLYIDDAALGAPLIYNESARPYICWDKVREKLIMSGVLK